MIESVHATAERIPRIGAIARRRSARRFAATVGACLALLPGTTHASPAGTTASVLATADEPTLTWEVLPKQVEGEPFRSNFSFSMKEGAEIKDTLRVRNYSTREMKLGIYASDAFNSEDGTLDLLAGGEEPKDIGSWIDLPMSNLTLAPSAIVDIPFTIKVPDDGVESGDHVGGIVTSFLGESSDAEGSKVTLDRRLGTRVQVRIDGPLNPSLAISKFRTSYDGTANPLGQGTLRATYTVTNDGNVRMAAEQAIKVKSPLGFPSSSVKLDPIPELLPGNSLVLSANVRGVWPTFRSGTTVSLTPKATREGDTFGADVRRPSVKGDVWSIPWAVLLSVLLLGAGLEGKRRLRERARHKDEERIGAAIEAKLGSGANGSAPGSHAPAPSLTDRGSL